MNNKTIQMPSQTGSWQRPCQSRMEESGVNSKRETRLTLKLKLVAALIMAAMFCGATVHAAEEAAAKTEKKTVAKKVTHHKRRARHGRPSLQRQINSLRGQLGNLRRAHNQLAREVRRIEHDIIVVPPASPTAAPRTVGEHVAVIEQDLSEVRRDLAENLGVHVHGLVDATYEANFNFPNSSTQTQSTLAANGTFPPAFSTTGPGTGGVKGGSPQSLFPGGRTNLFRAFDTEANGFNLTQFNLHLDRTVESGLGFVLDLNFGKTAEILRFNTRYSNTNPGPTNFDTVDPTQAYLTYTIPVGHGLNIYAGKFVTLLGAEVVPTYNNLDYNESRSFIFTFGIPFTHTGIRAQYPITDRIGVTLGVNNGWNDVADNNDGKSVEGQVALTPTDWLGLAVSGTYGPEQVNRGNSQRGVIDTVATIRTPIRGLSLVGEYDYGSESPPITTAPIVPTDQPGSNALFFPGTGILGPNFKCNGLAVGVPTPVNAGTGTFEDTLCDPTDWQGGAVYVILDVTDRLTLVGRGEYFRDSDGVLTGIRQSLWEGTFTINYKLANGLLARLEYRHDESNARPFETNDPIVAGPVDTAFGIGVPTSTHTLTTDSSQDTLEGALIYSF